MCLPCVLVLVPLLPLAGFIVNGLLGHKARPALVGLIGCMMPALSFACAALVSYHILILNRPDVVTPPWSWIQVDKLSVGFGLRLDTLSAIMILIVTGVGTLIHIYSIGYMKGDPGTARYFAYLNLFMSMMLVLVLADNLLLMFVGWEGVGLCSYLLIGFWYKDLKNADAGKKAFIVNRVGDFGFLLGIFWLFMACGSLDFKSIEARTVAGTVPALLLFLGACGKSAQIPLYVWLPDAMAGPTPVSALIHAATMVTAGVYMICRLDFLFVSSPLALGVIGIVAAATALISAIIACAQNDIKKVLAYSTISQLGYMFMALSATAFTAGIFHLMTHAFFKALLFLSAGAVIHALAGEQDLRKMGGLARPLRLTFLVFVIGGAALAGIPPFAGFFSKDFVLESMRIAYHQGSSLHLFLWGCALITAFLTAFYITRLICMAFLGSHRGPEERLHHVHRPDGSMKFALLLLATLSVLGGFIRIELPGNPLPHFHVSFPPLACAFGGAGLAVLLYVVKPGLAGRWTADGLGQAFHRLAGNKFYVDELYDLIVVLPLKMGALILWLVIDRFLVDTVIVHGLAGGAMWLGRQVRRTQTGVVNTGTAAIVLGTVAALMYLLYRTLNHG